LQDGYSTSLKGLGKTRPRAELETRQEQHFLVFLFILSGGGVLIGHVFPVWALMLIIGAVLAALVWFTSENLQRPIYQWVSVLLLA